MSLTKKRYLDLQEQEDIYLNSRRAQEAFTQVIYKSRRKETPEVFESKTKYTFLQYHRVIFEWAQRKTGLSRDYIDLLLYLQPIGVFNPHQARNMCNTINVRWGTCYSHLMKNGFLKIWREKKGKQHILYALTQKATSICTHIHKMIIGEMEVPSGSQSIMSSPKKPTNTYYLDLIKEMNQKKAERESNSLE